MFRLRSLSVLVVLASGAAIAAFARERTVAITVDDLPYASGSLALPNREKQDSRAEMANDKLLAAFKRHHVPVTGFVIQKRVEELGPTGTKILQRWTSEGLNLGNHTYSHPDIDELSVPQIEEEIIGAEATLGPLMKRVGRKPEYLRFPMNHTGDTQEKHDAVAAFLSQRGYKVATCTIDNSDYLFNNAYVRMLANNDDASAKRLRREYLSYTSTEIDYYAALNRQVFGYEPPQVMLLHANRLNADVIDQLLSLFEKKLYHFVSLDAAQSDAAYQTPDTYVSKYGPMWGYRWAKERNVKVEGSLEAEPPNWISQYGNAKASHQ